MAGNETVVKTSTTETKSTPKPKGIHAEECRKMEIN
jgi:hypothetical protein